MTTAVYQNVIAYYYNTQIVKPEESYSSILPFSRFPFFSTKRRAITFKKVTSFYCIDTCAKKEKATTP